MGEIGFEHDVVLAEGLDRCTWILLEPVRAVDLALEVFLRPFNLLEFWKQTRAPDPADYDLI
ncbi:MAG: hypothetical protein QMC74_08185 [Myxococcota bacterium]